MVALTARRSPHLSTGSPAPDDPVVLVCGARAASVHRLLYALFGAQQRLLHAPWDTYVVLRGSAADGAGPTGASGSPPAGHRAPPVALGCLGGSGGADRPPQRVDAVLADPLLDGLVVLATRAHFRRDPSQRRLSHELLERSGCLVLVSDGRYPFEPAEVDLVQAAHARGLAVFVALTHVDEHATWPQVVCANQAKLVRRAPDLALHSWYPLTRTGAGVADLRRAIAAWAGEHREHADRWRKLPVIRLAVDAAASAWYQQLCAGIDAAHRRVLDTAGHELPRLRDRLDQATSDAAAPGAAAPGVGVAERLEIGLQALSVMLAAELRRGVDGVLDAVLSRVLAHPLDPPALARVRRALRQDLSQRCCERSTCFRILRITGSGAAALSSSPEPVAVLAAHQDEAGIVLPPLGIGLTVHCHPMISAAGAHRRTWLRAWIARAVTAVEAELARELAGQFRNLRLAVVDLVSEGLDHDLLLV